MNKLALTLLSSSTVLGSTLFMLLTVNPADADERRASSEQSTPQVSPTSCACSSNPTNNIDSTAIPKNRLNSSRETPTLDFTEEESDAAIQQFGCDCLGCVNAIRRMRGLLPVSIR